MTDTPKTVFVTKYALTDGILECRACFVRENGDAQLDWPDGNNRGHYGYFDHREWEETREAAVTRANAIRDAKLQALQQQAERVKGLRFE